jgi:pSer/pThr/pTyr-binding forkhead associated (FHA) protein
MPPLMPPEPLLAPDPLVASVVPASGVEADPIPALEEAILPVAPVVAETPVPISQPTLLQQPAARLLHLQTNATIELPLHLSVVHLGKPNDRIPPDIDVSGFPNSEIVSRIHADIRVEAGAYYIEDVGSSNGTYVNNSPLPAGNRHRLRAGDRISLGKGDKVTFLFQMT